jgi:hypothetical protein
MKTDQEWTEWIAIECDGKGCTYRQTAEAFTVRYAWGIQTVSAWLIGNDLIHKHLQDTGHLAAMVRGE